MTGDGADDHAGLGRFAPGEHRYPQRLFLEDISGGNHVYNGHYLRYVERARLAMFRLAERLDPAIGRHRYEQYQVVAVEQRFLLPAMLDDELIVTTRIGHMGRSSCRLDHALLTQTDQIATASVTLVFTEAGRPVLQPRGWAEVFARLTG